jgi:membrane protease YdiL (CAAX protease family)
MTASPEQDVRAADWGAAHGGLLLVLLALPAFIPGLARWPWHLLTPVLIYGGIVAVVPPLRRSLDWLRVGRLDGRILAVSAAIVLISAAALVLYYLVFRPDLQYLAEHLPTGTGMTLLLAGAFFSVTNAVLEEIVFRGVLQQAFAARLGISAAVVLQGVAFGIAHLHGYPPGPVGAVLAGIDGIVQGALRQWSGGLAAAVLTHICADATIFTIVEYAPR